VPKYVSHVIYRVYLKYLSVYDTSFPVLKKKDCARNYLINKNGHKSSKKKCESTFSNFQAYLHDQMLNLGPCCHPRRFRYTTSQTPANSMSGHVDMPGIFKRSIHTFF
jgi:hypothetical protein